VAGAVREAAPRRERSDLVVKADIASIDQSKIGTDDSRVDGCKAAFVLVNSSRGGSSGGACAAQLRPCSHVICDYMSSKSRS
jgi:hypothetical protein